MERGSSFDDSSVLDKAHIESLGGTSTSDVHKRFDV